MTVRFAQVVNWNDLWQAVWVSLVAGVGISAAYGCVLLGFVRAREHYDRGDMGQAALYGAVGLAGLAATLAGIAVGLLFMIED